MTVSSVTFGFDSLEILLGSYQVCALIIDLRKVCASVFFDQYSELRCAQKSNNQPSRSHE